MYKNGKIESWLLIYHENGKLKDKAFCVKSLYEGTRYQYYENGQLKEEAEYKNCKLHGIRKQYDENGNLTDKSNYLNDVKVE